MAAHALYGAPAIVVDFGTATNFDVVSPAGDYIGGAIAPGIEVAAEAIFRRGARLFNVALDAPPQAIGRNTVAALQSGIVLGYVGLIEGIVDPHPGRTRQPRPRDRHRRPGGPCRPPDAHHRDRSTTT